MNVDVVGDPVDASIVGDPVGDVGVPVGRLVGKADGLLVVCSVGLDVEDNNDVGEGAGSAVVAPVTLTGDAVGNPVGASVVGNPVGDLDVPVGCLVVLEGVLEGLPSRIGASVTIDGVFDGSTFGPLLGIELGLSLGDSLGTKLGSTLGVSLGTIEGELLCIPSVGNFDSAGLKLGSTLGRIL